MSRSGQLFDQLEQRFPQHLDPHGHLDHASLVTQLSVLGKMLLGLFE
jgi:hypothetical protein